jgi:hypothetical protein
MSDDIFTKPPAWPRYMASLSQCREAQSESADAAGLSQNCARSRHAVLISLHKPCFGRGSPEGSSRTIVRDIIS